MALAEVAGLALCPAASEAPVVRVPMAAPASVPFTVACILPIARWLLTPPLAEVAEPAAAAGKGLIETDLTAPEEQAGLPALQAAVLTGDGCSTRS